MRVLPDVVGEIALDAVVEAELHSTNKLMPPRWGDVALRRHAPEVTTWMKSVLRRDFSVEPEQIVLARKLGRGGRPCASLGLKERLVFRGAVSIIADAVGGPDRSQDAYDTFQQGPLTSDECKYVLKADIASYYEFVDHERLVEEVVAQTGDDLAVTAATELLALSSGRRLGLPQLCHASDVLAHIYLDPMRRSMVRAGFEVWNFADDFRVACRSYHQALAALEVADRAARSLGLILNELKTSTPKIDRYRDSLTAVADREAELFEHLDIEVLEEPDFGEYFDPWVIEEISQLRRLLDEDDFEEGDDNAEIPELFLPEVRPGQIAAAQSVITQWSNESEDDDVQRSERAHVTAKLLARALRVFTRASDPSALEHVPSILVYEPSLTPTVARYIVSCRSSAGFAASRSLDDACRSGIASTWQSIWLAFAAGQLGETDFLETATHVEWLRLQCRSSHSVLRAEAALALARRRSTTADFLLEVSATLAGSDRPTALLALAAIGSQTTAEALAESDLDRLRIPWGAAYL